VQAIFAKTFFVGRDMGFSWIVIGISKDGGWFLVTTEANHSNDEALLLL